MDLVEIFTPAFSYLREKENEKGVDIDVTTFNLTRMSSGSDFMKGVNKERLCLQCAYDIVILIWILFCYISLRK